ncbi:glycosyltransferase family 4 protein [Agilicoccus flavus]|uniref:glycosyltransferase family 4 protein n=1 Tax=Agilicoccus flavus TaxID=2775968 RepID=UPI001CF6451D|nr:glycosyltransferase family 4 protein [Agilicoccus flavus]
MRVGLLTQWFDPEPGPAALPGVLARGLVDRGHEVRVLTGFPNYPSGVLADGYRLRRRLDERVDGVDITRVALYPSHDASPVRRLTNYASFGASSLVSGIGVLAGLDALWVNYSPVTVAPTMWAARYALGVPLVCHVGDLWPDTLAVSGFDLIGRTAGSAAPVAAGARAADAGLHAWCRAMYAASGAVSYISPGVGDVLRSRGVPDRKLAYAPMWADETTFRPPGPQTETAGLAWRRSLGVPDDAVLLLYAGALGAAQGLDTLVRAAARVDDPRLRVVVAGSGTHEDELRSLSRSLGRSSRGAGRAPAEFVGRVPTSLMPTLLAGADAGYVGLSPGPGAEVTMPSKTQATMAASRALVVCADGDVRDVVADSGAGWSAPAADVDGLSGILRALCDGGRAPLRSRGRAARRYYEETFSVTRAVDRAESLLTAVRRTREER